MTIASIVCLMQPDVDSVFRWDQQPQMKAREASEWSEASNPANKSPTATWLLCRVPLLSPSNGNGRPRASRSSGPYPGLCGNSHQVMQSWQSVAGNGFHWWRWWQWTDLMHALLLLLLPLVYSLPCSSGLHRHTGRQADRQRQQTVVADSTCGAVQ